MFKQNKFKKSLTTLSLIILCNVSYSLDKNNKLYKFDVENHPCSYYIGIDSSERQLLNNKITNECSCFNEQNIRDGGYFVRELDEKPSIFKIDEKISILNCQVELHTVKIENIENNNSSEFSFWKTIDNCPRTINKTTSSRNHFNEDNSFSTLETIKMTTIATPPSIGVSVPPTTENCGSIVYIPPYPIENIINSTSTSVFTPSTSQTTIQFIF